MYPASAWFAAFVLTVVVETPIVMALMRRSAPNRIRLVLLIVFANLATHPLVWFVYSQILLVGTAEYTIAAEAWAVVAEAVFYWTVLVGISPTRAGVSSLAANAASFAVGLVAVEIAPDLFV